MEHDAERPGRDRPLAGIGGFATKLAIGTALAVLVAAVAIRLIGTPARAVRAPARGGPAPAEVVAAPAGRARPATLVASDDSGAAGPVAREIERRHAAGELSEAQRRFEACPGGDLRRVAWIDRQQRVRKIVRHRAGGAVVEEWFDDGGRLREAAVQTMAAGRPWRRRVVLDERGRETVVAATEGLAPEEPPPPLRMNDPVGAFFSDAGCAR